MSRVVPNNFRLEAAASFKKSVVDGEKVYYAWVGNHVDPSSTRAADDSTYYTLVDPYSNMIMGKRIEKTDIEFIIPLKSYVGNTVYDVYDDLDSNLFDKDFYVTVTSGDFVHCFKCLDNAGGIPSTASPDFGDVVEGAEIYETSDGYRWKYMFTADDETLAKFIIPGMIPVVANTTVEESATPGTINVIRVDDPGEGYRNHINGTFTTAEIRVGGNNLLYAITSSTAASGANGFYTGCLFYISTGASSGSYQRISNYFTSNTGKYVVLSSPFDNSPGLGDSWEITPEVIVNGTSDETSNAVARAIINSVGNTVHRVEILNVGGGYVSATANVIANSIVGVAENAVVRPVAAPAGGHGANSAAELGCTRLIISTVLEGSESGTVPAVGDFGQYGLMTRPVFTSANVSLNTTSGVFSPGATAYCFSKKFLQSGASATVSNSTIIFTGNANEQVETGDFLYFVSAAGSTHFGEVTNVANGTHVVIDQEFGWASSNVTCYSANVLSTSTVTDAGSGYVSLENIKGDIPATRDLATKGGAWGNVSTVERNGVTKTMATFVQTTVITGSYSSGTIVEGEQVYQGGSLATSTASAYVHSVVNDGGIITLYLTRVVGDFNESLMLKGATGEALFTISNKYNPEIVYGTGRILYVENSDAVTRSATQKERLNFTLEF